LKPSNKKKAGDEQAPTAGKQITRMSQAAFPLNTLQNAQRIAVGLSEQYGGQPASPPDVALAIDMSPTSSNWRDLCGSSIGYGLTEGGWNAHRISLTALGKRLVAPEQEGDDVRARVEAILKPKIMREFFEKYRRAKFPNDVIAKNVLRTLGIPNDRLESALQIVKANGQYAGIIRQTHTGPFVHLESPVVPSPAITSTDPIEDNSDPDTAPGAGLETPIPPVQPTPSTPPAAPTTTRVFITHGKKREILNQIKELLSFGQYDPVISVERETTAIPVPEKVFEDMRSCQAGVIHVSAEGQYTDTHGEAHPKINDNVLIEIGAAMALFGKKVILLVEKGVVLPSNLQGLYRCEYEGDRLDYDATMKLLKTFNQFRQ
jgi:hypothetical protein